MQMEQTMDWWAVAIMYFTYLTKVTNNFLLLVTATNMASVGHRKPPGLIRSINLKNTK